MKTIAEFPKRIFMKATILLSLIGVLCLVGCEDLNEEPIGVLAPEGFFKTEKDVVAALNGSYSAIASEEFWGRKLTLALLLRGDMVTIGDPTTTAIRIQVDNFQMDASNGMVEAMWVRGFEAVASANIAIEGAELIEAPEAVKNRLTAEGRFLRAFVYYHMVRLYGEIPYVDYTFTDAESGFTVPQDDVETIYSKIIGDLEYAKEWLPEDQGIRSRPTQGTAAAYLASVHLTNENWQEAYDEAKFVIDNRGLYDYALTGDFQNLFNAGPEGGASIQDQPDVAKEFVFAIDFRGKDESSLSGFGNYTRDYLASVTGPRGDERFSNGEGWSVAVPPLAVYNSWDSRDYRKAVSFDTVTIMGDTLTPFTSWNQASRGVARPHIAKYYRYFGDAGLNGRDSDHNFAAMRFSEVLLIAAEALNEINTGATAEAESYVNEVRSRARRELDGDSSNDNMFPENVNTGLSYQAFLDLVMEERRLEFAFEFKRWYDIVRRQLGTEAFGAGGLEPNANFNPARDYLFPKAQLEISVNRNITQNDLY